jgi:hypothetical protein
VTIRQPVALVHGILSKGAWYDIAVPVLSPHFHCVQVRYWQFEKLGAFFLVLTPFGVLAVAFSGGAWVAGWLDARWFAWAIAIACFAVMGLMTLRAGALVSVRRQLGSLIFDPRGPHVIAHSFGTYLSVRALKQSTTLLFGRVIFVGCVLPRTYRWPKLAGRYEEVRNETGSRDGVALLACALTWLGRAGRNGFHGDAAHVHDVGDALAPCGQCVALAANERVRVHNVSLGKYDHTEFSVEARHAADLWLPTLWGYSPLEFREFTTLCTELAESIHNGVVWKQTEKLAKISDRAWSWTRAPETTFRDYVEGEIQRYCQIRSRRVPEGDTLVGITNLVITEACSNVAKAIADRATPPANRDIALARQLLPEHAVGAAVIELLGL